MEIWSRNRILFSSACMGLLLFSIPGFGSEKKEWAILTYLNGFNNLDGFGYKDMNEMEQVGSTARVHVVTQWASLKTKEVKRVYLIKDEDPIEVTSPVVENLGQIDMGDYRALIDFVKWAAKNYPAKQYFLNIWNHGNGWHFQGPVTGPTRDLSYDDLSGNRITTEELGLALAEVSKEIGQKIDLLGSDSCLMAMAEVMGEVKSSVSHFVGSEEVEPGDGWPYDTFLSGINRGGPKTQADLGRILTKAYIDSYPNGRDATLSTTNLDHYEDLTKAIRDLAKEIKLQPNSIRQNILQAVARTQSYSNDDYKDLGDFIDQMASDLTIGIRPEILIAAKTALHSFVISNDTTDKMKRSQGVSIWFPDASWQFNAYKDRYQNLNFNKDTGWMDAVSSTLNSSSIF